MSKQQSTQPGNNQKMPRFNLNWLYLAIIVALAYLLFNGQQGSGSYDKRVDYSQFRQYVTDSVYGNKVTVNKSDQLARLEIYPAKINEVFGQSVREVGKRPTVSAVIPSVDALGEDLKACPWVKVEYETSNGLLSTLLINILPILLLVVLWFWMLRGTGRGGGGGIFSVGKSKARLFEKGAGLHVTFKDVAGQDEAKQEVQEIVDFLKNPKKYTNLGGKIPKGALLVGPPGTGKTLLAKAVAGEADVPFFSMSGSDFVEMFVGVGASRVRDLFRQAKEKAPCIIFIDEIDAVGRARGKNAAFGGNDERENTLNQLLTEMDGFGTNSGVIILAATNRVDILDKALLRAGRFDRQIHVDLPDLSERVAIFQVHMKPLKLASDIDVDFLARQTPGFSGADIANVCNEAALIAARFNHASVTRQDFLDAVDRIVGGLEKKSKVMTDDEKRSIAIHEAGHATVSWLLEYANPLVKVTIVPRGQALGAAWYLPEERTITTKEQMLDEICATLGGRAAEELFTGHISSGALNDLERVTKRSYGMVAYLGMSDGLSNICYYDNQEYAFTKPFSEKTAEKIDAEVQHLINEQYLRAKEILSKHKAEHARLAQLLIENEVIYREDVERIFGPRPWKSRGDQLLEEQEEANRRKAEAMAEAHALAKAQQAAAGAEAGAEKPEAGAAKSEVGAATSDASAANSDPDAATPHADGAPRELPPIPGAAGKDTKPEN